MGIFGELIGLASDISSGCARMHRGWKPAGSAGYSAYRIALDAFVKFDRDRNTAIKCMEPGEVREYDRLREEYPRGYAEYCHKMDEWREREKLRTEDRYKKDPLGAWVDDLRNEENARIADAEWDMAVDRDRGIYRPRSSYGL